MAAAPRHDVSNAEKPGALAPNGHMNSRWLLSAGALALAAALVPYLLGSLAAPAGRAFGGALNNTGDLAQYLAMIRQGAAGHWLYRDQFTALTPPRVLMFPLYALLGQTLGRLGFAPLAVYHLGRVVCDALLLGVLWWFCGLLFAGRFARRTAFAVTLLGSGLYWMALLAAAPLARWGVQPADLTAPEYSAFTVMLGSPHVTLGLAAQLGACGCYLRALAALKTRRRHGLWRPTLVGALSAVMVGLTYPFNLLPLALIVGLIALAAVWRGEGLGALLIAALIVVPSLPLALYYYALFRFDPVWQTSGMAIPLPANPLVHLLAFGPLGLLALRGLTLLNRAGRAGPPLSPRPIAWGWPLVALWAAVPAVLSWVPLWQAVRLANGWSIALGLLAVPALLGAVPPAPPARAARRVVRGVLFLSLSNLLLVAIYCLLVVQVHPAGYYVPSDLIVVGDWLARHGSARDVVLSSAGTGNVLVAQSDVAVVAGQNFQTFDRAASLGAVAAYFGPALTDRRRLLMLRRYHVTLVLAGPWERALGPYDPARAPYLRLVLRAGAWRLFQVVQRGSGLASSWFPAPHTGAAGGV